MSTTLYRTKPNGERYPIKLDIFAAFRGCPNPRPRPCPCCGKTHPMTIKAREQIAKDDCIRNGGTGIPAKQIGWKDGNDGKDGKDGKKGQSKAENGGKKTYSTSGEEKYTSEEDLLIKKLKEEGTPWKKILTALGKNSESQLRAHWKTLEGKPTAAEAADNAEENAQKLDKQAKAEKNKAEGLKKQAEAQAKKDGKGKKNKGQEKKVDTAATKPNVDSSTGVKEWADRYDEQKWSAIAAKHFDTTGGRITAEEAQDMAKGK